jgi:hypothetical protein
VIFDELDHSLIDLRENAARLARERVGNNSQIAPAASAELHVRRVVPSAFWAVHRILADEEVKR